MGDGLTWEWSSFESVYEVDPGNNATATGLKSGDPTVGGSFSVQLLAEGTFRFRSANKGHVMTVVVRGFGMSSNSAVAATDVLRSGVEKVFSQSFSLPGSYSKPLWTFLRPVLALVEFMPSIYMNSGVLNSLQYDWGNFFEGYFGKLVFVQSMSLSTGCVDVASSKPTMPSMFGNLRVISSDFSLTNAVCSPSAQNKQGYVNWRDFDSVEEIYGRLSISVDTSPTSNSYLEPPSDFLPNLKCIGGGCTSACSSSSLAPQAWKDRMAALPVC